MLTAARPQLTSAVPSISNFQLRVSAFGALKLAARQEGPAVRRAEGLLRGAPTIQAAVLVFILINSQKLGGGKKKKPDKGKERSCRVTENRSLPEATAHRAQCCQKHGGKP